MKFFIHKWEEEGDYDLIVIPKLLDQRMYQGYKAAQELCIPTISDSELQDLDDIVARTNCVTALMAELIRQEWIKRT